MRVDFRRREVCAPQTRWTFSYQYVLHHYFTVTDSFELRDNKSLKRCQCTRKGKIDSLKLNLIDVGSNKITAQLKYACQCPIYEVALISKQNTNAIS